ncbi:hypothetical protein [Gymnodinialimonas sp. 57CJ19]|uniref:hypothetical protein n=1 Tax=Gymnodinialimonas sp. 57CJ19 TaxID=3138498 RepID=UPI0031343C6E
MIRTAPLALALAVSALPAQAQSTFERYEAVTVTMNAMTFEAMVAQTPALEGHMPSAELSDDLQAAYSCMFDGFVDLAGDAAVTQMVTEMEAHLATLTPAEVLAGSANVVRLEGVSDDQTTAIVMGCNTVEAFMAHLSSTGALQILMQADQ